ncbi:MAG TPA: L-seryl-tRNA(Sec) selenium transferase [Pyrinomonadaceae bacterium]|nr:L-seryl-tRNA(Sec) selenium transferase [Pyrinomonadaceae bacterium]
MPNIDPTNALLRALPSVDSLLKTEVARRLGKEVGAARLSSFARRVTNELRDELLANPPVSAQGNGGNSLRTELLIKAERRLNELHQQETASGLRQVINATGVILHTNLGRAPLSAAARRAIDAASGYCSLEYDIPAGVRGRRGGRVEDLLIELTGAEGAIVVNNCAAAALLVLSTLARDGETIVSRGELVEIGGDFRVPDVMSQSGTRMVEVGTTNRTALADYRKAISQNTRLLMRVHTSNFRIVGFTRTPALAELASLAHEGGLLLYEDAGSGALVDLSQYGIEGEPYIRESLADGADVVSFSGDKLMGGPQAGMIVGRAQLIERMRSNPLYRALRADKLRLAALEATLEECARESPVTALRMISMTAAEIGERADALIAKVAERVSSHFRIEKVPGESAVGGGSAPTSPLPTFLISVAGSSRTPNEIEAAFRSWRVPIIVRIVEDRVLIDLRTVGRDEEAEVEQALESL